MKHRSIQFIPHRKYPCSAQMLVLKTVLLHFIIYKVAKVILVLLETAAVLETVTISLILILKVQIFMIFFSNMHTDIRYS